ncbi:actin-related protein 4 - ARP4 [Klebsormidium nitens]|uniref:Actin-related protein 4 n=1 Tax=Klebsormidium nitens TaxID=105231 RepID=A0A1Y1ILU8_KLENI|nr:actin-related protein 4 - ARP4 [Klebsormidium nitens]|eukprot:GAQ90121.1 actin-related protein 4 - ARP4 [Klebsormidium nitens]
MHEHLRRPPLPARCLLLAPRCVPGEGAPAASMYGGDEVSAIVVDVGSHTCKAGYAGEDAPKAVFPSVVGAVPAGPANDGGSAPSAADGSHPPPRKLYTGIAGLGYRRDHMEVVPCMEAGLVADWDVLEALWDHALRERLQVDPREHPMLLAEPSHNTPAVREKTVELMFEKYGAPALFLAKNAVLTSFASGRPTSLVVDSGGSGTTVAAVHDGLVLHKSVLRSPLGGDLLTRALQLLLQHQGVQVRPRYSFKRQEVRPGEFEAVAVPAPGTTASYAAFSQQAITADVKEAVCRVADAAFDEAAYANVPGSSYELPDGNVIEVGSDRFKVPELLFNPAGILPGVPAGAELGLDGAGPLAGVASLVLDSVNKCDVDIRRELFNTILLAGGSTLFSSFKERLEREVQEIAPQTAKVKVTASSINVEKRFSVWIGGSILASLGTFQQMWLSKSEYEEHGAQYVHRKCP